MLSMHDKVPRRYRQDIQSLKDANLLLGGTITMTLQEFGQYCERDQLKIAAYTGLGKYLQKAYGISLCLTSKKTRGDSINEENAGEQTY